MQHSPSTSASQPWPRVHAAFLNLQCANRPFWSLVSKYTIFFLNPVWSHCNFASSAVAVQLSTWLLYKISKKLTNTFESFYNLNPWLFKFLLGGEPRRVPFQFSRNFKVNFRLGRNRPSSATNISIQEAETTFCALWVLHFYLTMVACQYIRRQNGWGL